ncbi:unnamed protein product [Rhizoctonia solani]|uniref:BZIP domain-containing protein n=1 Tax=Rhizoctonia solani TaxID=456999 RepID=A0A8H3DX43_9AGAM|nr:unnamed protein product [Rhizoctonia solani]
MAHMALPTPYYDDHEQLLQAFNERFNAWNPIPQQAPMQRQFTFPSADQFAAVMNQHQAPMQFKMPSPPVSPSSYGMDMQSPHFVAMANIAPPRNDTVFGWNSVSVSQAGSLDLDIGAKTAEETLSAVLRSRSCLKRPASPSPTPSLSSSTSSTSPAPMQPEVAPAPVPSAAGAAAPKRARTQISSKDFVPPDVTGLSKREARLVKNRAAAFLSRQRKREEFEELEKHCQELERELARLKAGQSQSPLKKLKADEPEPSQDATAELAQLRESNAQLAAQNAQLSAQNAKLTAENARLAQREVKIEDEETSLLLCEPSSRREKESKEKHGTGSVALMVLMISLSLLGKPLASGLTSARAKAPMSLHTPSAPQPSAFDYVLPRTNPDYEWLTSPTDLDHDDFASIPPVSLSASPATRTLTVQGLETLDIPTDIRDFNFSMDVDERDARNVVLAVSNTHSSSSSSSGASTLSSPSSASMDSVWPEPSVDSTMTMLGGDYMSYDYESDIFAPVSTAPKQPSIAGTRRMTVAVVPPSQDSSGRWSVQVKESL